MKIMTITELILAMLIVSVPTIRSKTNEDEVPTLRKIYTNDFIFKLKSEQYIETTKQKAKELGFVYQSQMLKIFLCFTRDDVQLTSDEAYDGPDLITAKTELSEYVESIEQDYERSWMTDSEAEQYAALHRSDNLHVDYNVNEVDNGQNFMVKFSGSSEDIRYANTPIPCEKRNINVAFVDIGFELDHPNLMASTNAHLSHDFIHKRRSVLPDIYNDDVKSSYPGLDYMELSHGTKAMGRVGAKAFDGCEEGVAPHVKLVGLKALRQGRLINDKREATALSYKHDEIDVFACCYGISEHIGFFGPRSLTKEALKDGATKSRDCQGVIYITPNGNGRHDNCNADGYANSVDTITVASVNRKGHTSSNREVCAAALAATEGSGYNTTTLNDLCSDEFEGTTAACAVAAGFVGELRFIRPCLSKRDIEHIMVKTAIPGQGRHWRTNGAGLKFNDYIGFGKLDLELMKKTAKLWEFVPHRHICEIEVPDKSFKQVSGSHWAVPTEIPSDACREKHKVNYMEHVQIEIVLHCNRISQVAIQLISPAQTVSNILTKMNISEHYEKKHRELTWTFMSVNFWRERADGMWTVKVIVENSSKEVECEYSVNKLVLYGTQTDPYLGSNQPETCKGHENVNGHTASKPVSLAWIAGIIVPVCLIALIVSPIYVVKRRRASSRLDVINGEEQKRCIE